MEVFNYTTTTTTLLLLFSSFFFLLIKACRKPKNAPPCPPRLPVIGHLHHLGGGGTLHHALTRINKKYGPVVSLQLGEVSTVVISSREAIKEVLKTNHPACADKPESIAVKLLFYNYTDIAFSGYSEYWRQMRRICISEMLSAKNVRSFGYIRAEEIQRLVESLQSSSGQAVNISEKISDLTFAVTCRAAFGQVVKGRNTFVGLLKEFSTMAGGFELVDLFPSFKFLHLFSLNRHRLHKIQREMNTALDLALEEHKLFNKTTGHDQFEGEDFVDVLFRMQKNKQLQFPITTDNIKAVILDIFAGGIETTATTTVWAMTELMRDPHVMAKAQSEIREALKGKTSVEEKDVQNLKYLKSVVKESLRLHPPFPIIPRKCREECKVGGYTIPTNAKLMINVGSLGRDPEHWENPESFQPERFHNTSTDFLGNDSQYLPFGSGQRNCPGMNFAIANVEFPLAQLLYHFHWKLPQGITPADVDLTEVEGLAVSRKTPLFLIPTPYNT
ncbi:hypothetical protein ACS0TY_023603 [Phlomoides rotata]